MDKPIDDLIVIDDFLPRNQFDEIINSMQHPEFLWRYNTYLYGRMKPTNQLNNYYFTHTFFEDGFVRSNFVDVIHPLLKKMKALTFLRVRAHLFPNNDRFHILGMHTDYDYNENVMKKISTGVFYLDNSDGKTVFEDGREVESKENRLTLFPSYFWHSSTNCTNMQTRRVINMDFISGI